MSCSLYPSLYSNSPRHTFWWWGSVEEFEYFIRNLKSSHCFFFQCNIFYMQCFKGFPSRRLSQLIPNQAPQCQCFAILFSNYSLKTKRSYQRVEVSYFFHFSLITNHILCTSFPMFFTISKIPYSGQHTSTCQTPCCHCV